MEIIHVVLGKANPERMNGVNKVVYQLASRQKEAGKEVSVWGITKEPSQNYGARNFNTELFKAQTVPFCVDPQLEKAIEAKKGKAIFHLHGGWIPVFSTVADILTKHKVPFVFTPHGAYNTIAMERSKWVKKMYFQLFEKKFLEQASRIHCIGKSEVVGVNSLFPSNKAYLQPYGFESISFDEKSAPTSNDPFIIGFVGRLDIYTKGLDLLLEAFSKFIGQHPNSKLWIVGDSNEREKLQSMIASKGLADDVILWGSKFGKDKDDLMLKMHVFAHPSRNEGLPASVLEASMMGIPCVVSEATNVADYIRKYSSGATVDNENIESLYGALMSMKTQWDTDYLTNMGKNARNMVVDAFNWNRIVSEFDQVYHLQ